LISYYLQWNEFMVTQTEFTDCC